jgi:hypothetical protein
MQALDFMRSAQCCKTYPLRNERQKIGGSLDVYIVLSTVWLLRSAGSIANARAGF